MGFKNNLTGKKFNRLAVLKFSHNSPMNGGAIWECICDCGSTSFVDGSSLSRNLIKSCGCLKKESKGFAGTHKMSKQPIYRRWVSMKARCNCVNSTGYHNYGGKGITYSPEWEEFEHFHKDMGPSFHEDLELDRIDVKGNYCKENCRWVTKQENSYNKNLKENNVSGKSGVSFDQTQKRWRAYINKDRKRIELGYFDNFKDAVEVRILEEFELYGYTRP